MCLTIQSPDSRAPRKKAAFPFSEYDELKPEVLIKPETDESQGEQASQEPQDQAGLRVLCLLGAAVARSLPESERAAQN